MLLAGWPTYYGGERDEPCLHDVLCVDVGAPSVARESARALALDPARLAGWLSLVPWVAGSGHTREGRERPH